MRAESDMGRLGVLNVLHEAQEGPEAVSITIIQGLVLTLETMMTSCLVVDAQP